MHGLSVGDARGILADSGINVTEASIRYWLRTGKIEGTPPPSGQPSKGWLISEQSLRGYIRERRPDMAGLERDLSQVSEELENLQVRYDEIQKTVQQPFSCDIELMIMEESERLGITYSVLVDELNRRCTSFSSHEELLRHFIQESLKQSMKRMIEVRYPRSSSTTYTEQSVPHLIERVAHLRQMVGGTPTNGEAALVYLQIREALKAKGFPLDVLGL